MTQNVTISCMDPRCTTHETEGTLKIRRLGGFVGGPLKKDMLGLLRAHGYEKTNIKLHPHDDCGAIKLVRRGVNDREEIDAHTYEALVSPFLRNSDRETTLERTYELAMSIQLKIAFGWRSAEPQLNVSWGMKRSSGHVGTERTLLLTTPTTANFSDIVTHIGLKPSSTYIITLVPGDTAETPIDVKVAIKYLGIHTVVVYPSSGRSEETISSFWRAYSKGDVEMPGVHTTRYA